MTPQRTTIFRAEAMRNHEQGQVPPSAMQCAPSWAVPLLWGVLVLLTVSGLVLWQTLATTLL